MTDDIESAPDPSNDDLAEVSRLAKRVLELSSTIDAAQAELDDIETKVLPELMALVGLAEFRLDSGEIVKRGTVVRASIPEEHRYEAHARLAAMGHGDLVKHVISLQFGKGESQQATRAYDLLRQEFPDLPIGDKESVHSGSLTALVKELLSKGQDVPLDLFGVFIRHGVTIKAARRKKEEL